MTGKALTLDDFMTFIDSLAYNDLKKNYWNTTQKVLN